MAEVARPPSVGARVPGRAGGNSPRAPAIASNRSIALEIERTGTAAGRSRSRKVGGCRVGPSDVAAEVRGVGREVVSVSTEGGTYPAPTA